LTQINLTRPVCHGAPEAFGGGYATIGNPGRLLIYKT